MALARHERVLDELRARIARLERGEISSRPVLPFGIDALDTHLPPGGLLRGALHEITDGGGGTTQAAAAMLFTAGILARLEGVVLWCLRRRDLFAPALAGVGLHPDRVIYAEAGDEATLLLCLEEGLRQGGLAAVVGEVSRLSMTASRRLQLAAETSGVTAFVLRRWRLAAEATSFDQPTASATRWRITSSPSAALPAPGIGRAGWRVELIRCRGGEPGSWELEACDAQGRLALSADMADRSVAAPAGRERAVA